jgi:hypothetical protein
MKAKLSNHRTIENQKVGNKALYPKPQFSQDQIIFNNEMQSVKDLLNELLWVLHGSDDFENIKARIGDIVGYVVDIQNSLFEFFCELGDEGESEESEEEQ